MTLYHKNMILTFLFDMLYHLILGLYSVISWLFDERSSTSVSSFFFSVIFIIILIITPTILHKTIQITKIIPFYA